MRRNRILSLAALLTFLVALTGCIKVDTTIVITNDRDVAFTVRTGAKVDPNKPPQPDACADPQFQGGKKTPYNDGQYSGCLYEFTTSISGQKVDGLTITRHDGVYDMTYRIPAKAAQDGIKPEGLTSFKVAVTFPGDVVKHNGSSTANGRTVTWTDPKDLFTAEGLHATGGEGESPSGLGFLVWAIPVGVVVLAAIVGVVIMATRKKGTSPAAPVTPTR